MATLEVKYRTNERTLRTELQYVQRPSRGLTSHKEGEDAGGGKDYHL